MTKFSKAGGGTLPQPPPRSRRPCFQNTNININTKRNLAFKICSTSLSSTKSIPILARVLYLFLCENQAEINAYTKAFPSITADVMFLCWRENCIDSNFSNLQHFIQLNGQDE